jgi:nicotinate dehydrogenase subunit B
MNTDKNMELDFRDITVFPDLNRRDFLKAIGSGIIILFWVGDESLLAAQVRGRSYPEDFNAYLKIGPDGKVTCFTGKIEMGQGIITSLAQMLAEELDVALDSVDMVMGDTSVCPWDMGTFGSMSTRFFGPPLRNAGAEARSVLIDLASEHLGTSPDNLATENGMVFEKGQKDKRVTYAQLAEGKTITKLAKQKPVQKKSSEFKVIGKETLRRDALNKVTGKAKYAGDIRLPGMVYARLVRPPSHGAKLTNIDTSAVAQVEGASVIRSAQGLGRGRNCT